MENRNSVEEKTDGDSKMTGRKTVQIIKEELFTAVVLTKNYDFRNMDHLVSS